MYFPSGSRGSSLIYVSKDVPAVVRVGEAFAYTIKVQNISDIELQQVGISEVIPSGFSVTNITPAATSSVGSKSTWALANLKPGETQTIKIMGTAQSKQDLPCCTAIDYKLPELCVKPEVIQPELKVVLAAPSTSLICDRIPLNFEVSNTGDGAISDVVITSKLPGDVLSEGGTDTISINAGSLGTGQTKEFTAYVKSKTTGRKNFEASASAAGSLSASAPRAVTQVNQPQLSVSASNANATQYVGREISYTFTVRNTGDIAAENTVLEAVVPSNTSYSSASDNARASGRTVRWNIGPLGVRDSKNVTLKVVAATAGQATANVSANATCCSVANASTSSDIAGIPALLLEVVDVEDPIEVGGQETYIITVTNQGSANATNIKIAAVLENMSYVSSSGTTKGTSSGDQVSFETLPKLGAQEKAVWRVNVQATKAGDTRFKTTMNSDQLGRSVDETESTFIY